MNLYGVCVSPERFRDSQQRPAMIGDSAMPDFLLVKLRRSD